MSDEPDSPLDVLLGWFDSLPVELQEDVAWQALILIPGVKTAEVFRREPSEHPDDLRALCKTAVAEDDPLAHAGMAVALSSIVDYVLLGRTTEDDWQQTKDFMQDAREQALSEGKESFAKTMELSQMKIPLKSRRWIQASKDWSELREGSLSPAAMKKWSERALTCKVRAQL